MVLLGNKNNSSLSATKSGEPIAMVTLVVVRLATFPSLLPLPLYTQSPTEKERVAAVPSTVNEVVPTAYPLPLLMRVPVDLSSRRP